MTPESQERADLLDPIKYPLNGFLWVRAPCDVGVE